MSARITVNVTADGEFEIWLNEEGRDLLVRELQHLSERHEHVHLAPKGMGEIEISSQPYRPTDSIFQWGKINFRVDQWDKEHFPHVMNDTPDP